MLLDGVRLMKACHRRYGNAFTLRVAGMGTLVYLADPADIKVVFAGDPKIFHAGEANSMLKGLLGESSVLVVDEEIHRERRRLMVPSFHREAVTKQAETIAAIAREYIAGWPVGRPFPVAPRMSQLTLEVILRTVIGATDPVRLDALREAIPSVLGVNVWNSLAFANPKLQKLLPWRGVRRRVETLDQLLYSEIADHRADSELATRTDVLALLMRSVDENGCGLTDVELRDQLVTLLAAGHDTTATGLAWALERLTRHPVELQRAARAARDSAAGDQSGDDYLDAVAKETLRIRPVVFDVGRILTEPVDIAGYRLPAGVMVVPAMGLVHVSPDVYENPDGFDPQRMLTAAVSPTTWFPFGGGNRRCLGANFAMVETRIVLREILRQVDLTTTTAPAERQRVKYVTLIPHRGARIRVRSFSRAPESGMARSSTPPDGRERPLPRRR
jgi:cytochrome P450